MKKVNSSTRTFTPIHSRALIHSLERLTLVNAHFMLKFTEDEGSNFFLDYVISYLDVVIGLLNNILNIFDCATSNDTSDTDDDLDVKGVGGLETIQALDDLDMPNRKGIAFSRGYIITKSSFIYSLIQAVICT